jgi:hypothetical protein
MRALDLSTRLAGFWSNAYMDIQKAVATALIASTGLLYTSSAATGSLTVSSILTLLVPRKAFAASTSSTCVLRLALLYSGVPNVLAASKALALPAATAAWACFLGCSCRKVLTAVLVELLTMSRICAWG